MDVMLAHDQLLRGSHDVSRECPGANLDMPKLRWEIEADPLARLDSYEAEQRLTDLGIAFGDQPNGV